MIDPEEYMATSAANLIWESVRDYPGYPALEIRETEYTYRQLYHAAVSISQTIRELDNPNPYVALMADKSFTCYAGILGIIMAGKAYMPLNPRFPAARNRYMLESAKVMVILAGEDSDDELEEILENYTSDIFIIFPEEMAQPEDHTILPKIVDPEDPAYLLFTSGTTGNPKGVSVSHQNLKSYLDEIMKKYNFGTSDRFTQLFDLTFDLSVHDIFLAWSSGACLVVPEENSSFAMARFIKEKEPTIWFSVPSVVNLMDKMRLLKPDAFPSIRLSFFCGEALQVKTAEAWKNAAPDSTLVNLYGPTEATIAISRYELDGNPDAWKSELGIISIGKVFDGNTSQVLKNDPGDDRGELCLGGNQVIKAYLDNIKADNDAFFIEKNSGSMFYKTGDIVREDPEGDLFYLGRKDSEVKISGYRVNLKEIESVLEEHEKIRQAVVIYDQQDDSPGMIIAFLQPELHEGENAGKDPGAFCVERLPRYMVPGKFIFVKDIPLNVNGKVDKLALIKNYRDGK